MSLENLFVKTHYAEGKLTFIAKVGLTKALIQVPHHYRAF